MNIKTLLLLLFFSHFLHGCCDTNSYDVLISGLETRALIFDGNDQIIIDEQTSIDKEDLVIELLINEFEEIALSEEAEAKVKVAAMAVVPCGDDEYIITNNIESVTVEIIDLSSNERIDVTDQLVILNLDEFISDYISRNSQEKSNFFMSFSDITDVPDSIDYRIEAILDSGSKISTTGGAIYFK